MTTPDSGGTSDWTEADGRRLRTARRRAGQTQSHCAAQLRRLGADRASQASVSEWERGSSRPAAPASAAIARYCELNEPAPASDHANGGVDADSSPEGPGFDDLVRELSNEPLLGPHQLALVEALTARLRRGPPLSDDDEKARDWLVRILRVE